MLLVANISPDYRLLPPDCREAVRAALKELPIRERTIVMMKHYSKYTDAEAAEVSGCSAQQFKRVHLQTLYHIHKKLRKQGIVVYRGLDSLVDDGIDDVISRGLENIR